ncbi:hypothetical protein Asp14428_59080 [Actinoplanes sp. NBRC 14428]|nr:hypothetical protein Asp14428_59080 [Actinoplanes sp. NBRC 14428]
MWRRAAIGTLVLYAAAVVAITIFPIRVHPASYWAGEPFMTMVHWRPGDVDAPSFTLNVIMFIPFGVLLPLLWPASDGLRAIAVRAVTASTAIETVQLVLGLTVGSRRTIDINDLIANTAGAVIGLLVLRLAVPSPVHRARVLAVPSGVRRAFVLAVPSRFRWAFVLAVPSRFRRARALAVFFPVRRARALAVRAGAGATEAGGGDQPGAPRSPSAGGSTSGCRGRDVR